MRIFGAIMIVCGLVIIACKIQELVTDSLKTPTLLVGGPLLLFAGIVTVIRVSGKGR